MIVQFGLQGHLEFRDSMEYKSRHLDRIWTGTAEAWNTGLGRGWGTAAEVATWKGAFLAPVGE